MTQTKKRGLSTRSVLATDHGLSATERARRGVSNAILRLSADLADADDVIAELGQAPK